MEGSLVKTGRLREKNKWVYSTHSQFSLQVERNLETTRFEVKRFGSLAEQIADGLHGVRHYVDDGIVMLAVGNVTEFGLDLSTKKMITPEEHEHLKRSQVQQGDLLLTITGRLGTALVYESSEPANLSAHVARVKVKPEAASPYYLAAYLNSRVGKQLIDEFSIGSLYPHINVNKLQNVRVILPPRHIQDRIAQVMQDAYATRREKLANAESLLGGIDKYVLGRLGIALGEPSNKKYFVVKSSRFVGRRFDIGPYANDFNVQENTPFPWAQLHELAELPREAKIASKIPDTEYAYIGMPDVDDSMAEINIQQLLGREIKANKTVFRGGDVVFARIEPCIYNRKIALIPHEVKEALGSTELLVARARQGILPEFLLWILRSELIQRQIAGRMTGTTGRRRLPSQAFARLKVPKVPLEFQREIADEATRQRDKAKELQQEAEALVTEAKARVERMILGQEEVS